MNTQNYIIGSVSSATMRPEDLIPCFMDTLAEFDKVQAGGLREEYADMLERLGTDDATDEDMESADYLLEALFDRLDTFAAPYFYFGSHPGDGADYGFWLAEDALQDFDGLKVSDTSEVPADYSGEVLHVNDHGNTTLYSAENGTLTEVWAIV
jgi:hypothetical protein